MAPGFVTRTLSRTSPKPLSNSSTVLDFLAPSFKSSWQSHRIAPIHARKLSIVAAKSPGSKTGPISSDSRGPMGNSTTSSSPKPSSGELRAGREPPKPQLNQAQRDFLDSALRVNQAGELAAVLIYLSQTPPLIRSHPHLRPLMQHMHAQEASHFDTFNALLAKHRVRPTAMYPVWRVAATALGWGTGLLGREAAMACTEAVETEIGGHYNEQVRVLLDWVGKMEARGELKEGSELKELTETLRRIRDEELEHLDHAVENDAKEAKPYELLTNVIRGGCRTAIWISERV